MLKLVQCAQETCRHIHYVCQGYIFVLQAKAIFTRRNTLILCSIIPVLFIATFATFSDAIDIHEGESQIACIHREGIEQLNIALQAILLSLYFLFPALTLICFNIAIAIRLRKIKQIYKMMTRQYADLSFNGISIQTKRASTKSQIPEIDYPSSSISQTDDETEFTTISATAATPSQSSKVTRVTESRDKTTLPSGVR